MQLEDWMVSAHVGLLVESNLKTALFCQGAVITGRKFEISPVWLKSSRTEHEVI